MIYCLTHHHEHGSDAYLFQSDHAVDPGEAAAQLGVDFVLDGEIIDVAQVVNRPQGPIPAQFSRMLPKVA